MLLHTGDKRYDYSNPNRLLPILETYTNLTVIGGHLGGYSVWDEAAEKLSGHKNFFVDTSSSMAFIGVEKAKSLIEIFTPEQVLFATDYPMYAQKTEINNILSMGFNDEDLEKIFSENAKKVFSL
jgi:predicted TIM-barrel fold metal-dependent hydrolase